MSSQATVTVCLHRDGRWECAPTDARATKLLAKAAKHGLTLTIVAPWAGRGGHINRDGDALSLRLAQPAQTDGGETR